MDAAVCLPRPVSPHRSSINMLLLMARDLRRDTSSYADIAPNLAFSSILRAKQRLEAAHLDIRLNVDVVRPGTLPALKKHLAQATEVHGAGYYDIAHIDLHGHVGVQAGHTEKSAFLWLAPKSGGDELVAIRARLIAELFSKHGIRNVIMNSCNSARADTGAEANLAQVFIEEGADQILAMSYKALESAATITLRTFYDTLLGSSNSFGEAARAARTQLRTHDVRPARYRQSVELTDWIVPVVYSTQQALQARREDHAETSTASDGTEEETESIIEQLQFHNGLLGRHFDILRFEKLALKSPVTILLGVAGVGKTAFMMEVLDYWAQTGLKTRCTTVNCGSLLEITNEDTLKSKLLAFQDPPEDATFSFAQKSSVHSATADGGADASPQDSRCVVVIEDAHLAFPAATEGDVNTFQKLFKKSMVDVSKPNPQFSIILVGRPNPSAWWKENFDVIDKPSVFELQGLDLSSARILIDSVSDLANDSTTSGKLVDQDAKDHLVGLVQGNPGTIWDLFLSKCFRDMSWYEFYQEVHFGRSPLIQIEAETLGYSFVERVLSGPLYQQIVLKLICLYWRCGPAVGELASILGKLVSIEDPKEVVGDALLFAAYSGFVQLDSQGEIAWIHPLFTICGRNLTLSGEKEDNEPIQKLDDAFACILSGECKYEEKECAASLILVEYFQGVETSASFLLDASHAHKMSPEEVRGQVFAWLPNALCALIISSRNGHGTQVWNWPSGVIAGTCMHMATVPSGAVRRLIVDACKRLLEVILSAYQRIANLQLSKHGLELLLVLPDVAILVLEKVTLLSTVVMHPLSDEANETPSRMHMFAEEVLQLAENFEQFGTVTRSVLPKAETAALVATCKFTCLQLQAHWLLRDRQLEAADFAWDRAWALLPGDLETIDNLKLLQTRRTEQENRAESVQLEDVRAWEGWPPATLAYLRENAGPTKSLWSIMRRRAIIDPDSSVESQRKDLDEIIQWHERYSIWGSNGDLEASRDGLVGGRRTIALIPEIRHLAEVRNNANDPLGNFSSLERAMDAEDPIQASQSHLALACQAFMSGVGGGFTHLRKALDLRREIGQFDHKDEQLSSSLVWWETLTRLEHVLGEIIREKSEDDNNALSLMNEYKDAAERVGLPEDYLTQIEKATKEYVKRSKDWRRLHPFDSFRSICFEFLARRPPKESMESFSADIYSANGPAKDFCDCARNMEAIRVRWLQHFNETEYDGHEPALPKQSEDFLEQITKFCDGGAATDAMSLLERNRDIVSSSSFIESAWVLGLADYKIHMDPAMDAELDGNLDVAMASVAEAAMDFLSGPYPYFDKPAGSLRQMVELWKSR
jgi:hypothetical protein